MAINDAALKRAQAIASATPVNRGGYDRALIQAYLSDEEVKAVVAETLVHKSADHATPDSEAKSILRAIGGR